MKIRNPTADMRHITLAALLITSFAFADEPLVVKSVSVEGTAVKVNLETQVGRVYDAGAIAADVRRLWETGRFDDIRVESGGGAVDTSGPGGIRMVEHRSNKKGEAFGESLDAYGAGPGGRHG